MVGGIAMIPFKKGLDTPAGDNINEDIIEEALNYFRPNAFSRSFEIRGPADRTLIYAMLLVSDCLVRIKDDMTHGDALKMLNNTVGLQNVILPGESAFPLNGMFPSALGGAGEQTLRAYLAGLRSELIRRLVARMYTTDASKPSPWWMAFQRRKFMNKSLSSFS